MNFPATVMSAMRDAGTIPPPQGLDVAGAVAPTTPDQAAAVLRVCAAEGLTVGFWGSGSRREVGGVRAYDIGLVSSGMSGVIDWQADDLTIVVESGMTVGSLEQLLATKGQTSLLPAADPNRTVGGVIAEGASGYSRLKYGPTRDRVLEATIVTGYGQVVRGGGRLVKNVTGYDLPRLVTGSMGSLGFITSVCLKLWPIARTRVVGRVSDPREALRALHRPVAVLETEFGSFATIEGSLPDIRSQAADAGATIDEELSWPVPMKSPVVVSVRVPARFVNEAQSLVVAAGADRWVAQHGVGIIDAGFGTLSLAEFDAVRETAENHGGAAVIARRGTALAGVDPWGVLPSAFEIQARMKTLFDPGGVCNPGKLPGGL